MIRKILSASLSPNTESDDVREAISMLFQPWKWKRGTSVSQVIDWFAIRYSNTRVFAFNSGRGALFELLRSFDIAKGDEVLVQSFTCVAVPNSVLWAGATPVYVDIDSSLNMSMPDAEKKITKRTRALIVQHTLGIPADMGAMRKFVKRHNLLLIEDCAHALGGVFDGENLGSMGDAAFFSFGRDKILSSVFGGVAIVKVTHKRSIAYLKRVENDLVDAPMLWIFQQIFHPIIFAIALPLYTIKIGKGIIWFFQKIHALSFPVYNIEKSGGKPTVFPSRYPNALASLLLVQLQKLERYNAHRKKITELYIRALLKNPTVQLLSYPGGAIFLRLPVLVDNPQNTIALAKKQHILLGNWYHNTIDPTGVVFESIGYKKGSCPKAEEIAQHVINLPTNITSLEASRVLRLFLPS